MIVGLGEVKLIKEEDVGGYFFGDDSGIVKVPDFRLVRGDGQRLLVEVKGVDPKQVFRPQRIREADLDALLRYADLTGGRLLLAHYWSAWNLWTLADPSVFRRQEGKLIVDMETAMKASELRLLGDATIATVPPLVFSLIADPSAPQDLTPDDSVEAIDLAFTVGGIELLAGGEALTDDIERDIAWFLIQFGRWKLSKEAIIDGSTISHVNPCFCARGKGARAEIRDGRATQLDVRCTTWQR